eukprot:5952427-Pleurochrysis_carterae.AAC.3
MAHQLRQKAVYKRASQGLWKCSTPIGLDAERALEASGVVDTARRGRAPKRTKARVCGAVEMLMWEKARLRAISAVGRRAVGSGQVAASLRSRVVAVEVTEPNDFAQ